LPLGKRVRVSESNSLFEYGVSDAEDVLHPQFHTSLHWQGFSKEATAGRERHVTDECFGGHEKIMIDGTYLSGVGELGQLVSYLKR